MTKQELKGKLALDASALIELVFCEAPGQTQTSIRNDLIEAWTTELALTELRYILCRKLGWTESDKRVNKLLASGYFKVENTMKLMNEAAKLKCCRAVSLPDCFTIALAQEINGKALFARKEQDLTTEIQRNPFDINILFLDDQAEP